MHLFHAQFRRSVLLAIAIGLGFGAGCSSKNPNTPTTVTVSSIAITGAGATASAGQSVSLVATATMSDGTTSVVTAQAAWESSNTNVATITPAGVVSFLAAGGVDFRASYRGVTGTAHVDVGVAAPTLTTLTISGIGSSATVGQSGNLVATATYSNNSTAVVTTQVAWSSSSTAVATVTQTGAVSFIAAGEVDLRAALGAVTATLHVSVSAQPVFRNLNGTVTDSVTNQPLESVVVQVRGGPNNGRSTQTNSAGGYSFTGLQTGSFALDFSTNKAYSSTSRDVTLSDDSRVDVAMTPSVGLYYGTYQLTLTVTQDTCQPPPNLNGFGSGTLELAGQSNGTSLTVKITERGVSRTYTGGRMNADGSFNGGLPPGTLFPGMIRLQHEVFASMQGKVTGNSLTGTEVLTYTVGCQAGATITIAISGTK